MAKNRTGLEMLRDAEKALRGELVPSGSVREILRTDRELADEIKAYLDVVEGRR